MVDGWFSRVGELFTLHIIFKWRSRFEVGVIWMDFFVFLHEHQDDRKFSILMKSEFWQEKNLASLPLPRSNDPSIINTQT